VEKPELLRFDGATDPEGRTRWLVDRWRLFTNHRQRIAEILCTLTDTQNHRLAVLGAGACTDLDLSRLTTAYKSITLIDIDGEALDCMPLLQKDVNLETIHTCGGVDLTGLYTIFEQWRMHPPDESAISDAMFVAANHRLPELDNGGFHVVLSDCVLSQIIEQTTLAMGESHPQLLRMIRQIRRRHLDLMLDLTNPGGHVVVVTDIVSSVVIPMPLNQVAKETCTCAIASTPSL
jgi:hypothetical protein